MPWVTRVCYEDLWLVVNRNELNDFELFLSGGGRNLNFVSDFLVQESASDRRSRGNHALFDVGFFAADQLVGDIYIFLRVQHNDLGSVASAILGNIRQI